MVGIRTLIDGNGVSFRVFVYAPGNAKHSNVRVVILPGANCAAERYRWLAGALAEEGATVKERLTAMTWTARPPFRPKIRKPAPCA